MFPPLVASDLDSHNALTLGAALFALGLGYALARFLAGRALRLLAALLPFLGGRFGDWLGLRLRQSLTAVALLLAAGVAAYGGQLWYQGIAIEVHVRDQLARMPPEFWDQQLQRLLKVLLACMLAGALLLPLSRLLAFLERRAIEFRGITANDASLKSFFAGLSRLVHVGVWIAVLLFALEAFALPAGVQELCAVLARVYWIAGAGWVGWYALDVLLISVAALAEERQDPGAWLAHYSKFRHLMPLLRRSLEAILIVLAVTLVVRQIEPIADLAEWGPRLIAVIAIVFLARALAEGVRLAAGELLLGRREVELEQRQRRETLVPLIESGSQYLIYFGAALMILERLQIDSTPFLAGAGIIGLAVGLGAQNLVNDVVSGFFVLFEDYYLVGDYVKIGDCEGVVERIDLRTTRIRDNDGRHHIIRNGQVDTVINYSKRYTFAVVEVGVAYESDLERVTQALEDAGRQLAASCSDVLEPTVVKGLIDFGESELRFRTVTRVRPGTHLAVQNQLRPIIKVLFDERQVEIPYPKRVLVVKNETGEHGPLGPDGVLPPMDVD
jgi:small-conductance mechanosensitive channel